MKTPQYWAEVSNAQALLANVTASLGDTPVTPDVIHPDVVRAHVHLKRACRMYRRARWAKNIWIGLEWNAVQMGFMPFTEVEKNTLDSN